MAETGSKYLERLKQEAKQSPLLVLIENCIVAGLVNIWIMLVLLQLPDQPLLTSYGYFPVVCASLIWTAITTLLYVVAYAAYLRHYSIVLADSNLLLSILDVPDSRGLLSFKDKVTIFVAAYSRTKLPANVKRYPVLWRSLALAALTASLCLLGVMLFVAQYAIGHTGQMKGYLYLIWIVGYMSAFFFLVYRALDRPRTIALRAALADALLRH